MVSSPGGSHNEKRAGWQPLLSGTSGRRKGETITRVDCSFSVSRQADHLFLPTGALLGQVSRKQA